MALDWTWSYLTFQRGARLITGPVDEARAPARVDGEARKAPGGVVGAEPRVERAVEHVVREFMTAVELHELHLETGLAQRRHDAVA